MDSPYDVARRLSDYTAPSAEALLLAHILVELRSLRAEHAQMPDVAITDADLQIGDLSDAAVAPPAPHAPADAGADFGPMPQPAKPRRSRK